MNYIKDLDLSVIAEVTNYGNNEVPYKASVVIVTYNTNKNLLSQNLNSLKEQTIKNFEIIIVDNSDRTNLKTIVSNYNVKYIKLKKNYGPSLARNVGIKFSKGNIIIFLDDDAIPANNFVEEHIRGHEKYDIVGLRGKSIPRTPSIYNHLASHYDLGDKPMPCPINLEGNSSFKRNVLIDIGGFDPRIEKAGGHEGLELSYRIFKVYEDKNKLIYYPNAIIFHDYSNNFSKYIKKVLRHSKYKDYITQYYPDVFKFAESYNISSTKTNKSLNLINRIKLKIIQKFASFILKIWKLLHKM